MKRCVVIAVLAAVLASCTAPPERPQPIRVMVNPGELGWEVEQEGRPTYVMRFDWPYCYDRTGDVIVVPKGFVTDFASIPKIAWGFFPPDGRYASAAIIHDYLYALGRKGDDRSRLYADQVFGAAMLDWKVPETTRNIVYKMVRDHGAGGYGLKSDWKFRDLQTLNFQQAPLRPRSVINANIGVGCPNFRAWTAKWRTGELAA